MRIISGELKGRRYDAPKGFKGRPTTDLARESLFNILQHRIELEGISVLDLFSGAGGVSYEFCSRGAKSVTGVEIVFRNVSYIRRQAKEFGFDQATFYAKDVFTFLKKTSEKFDLIFADPPFPMGACNEIVELVYQRELLNEGGLLIIEHPSSVDYSSLINFEEKRNYGHINFSFFEKITT